LIAFHNQAATRNRVAVLHENLTMPTQNLFLRCVLASLLAMMIVPSIHAQNSDKDIRLVLQITVDGLRADLLSRYSNRFGEGGFRLLKQHGTIFANAHYQHANTETIVGHSTLATGAQPSVHGMTGNVWFDAETGELSYNIEDADAPILSVRKEAMTGDQVDPAQQLARTAGRSPRALLAETFADKLKSYTGGRARVFGVSGKDRGAVAMAGKAGKAFWISSDSGDFVTSTYYFQSYPGWVVEWNAERKAEALAGKSWELLNAKDTYLLAHQDDRPYETDLRGYGRTFPHEFGGAGNKLLYTQVIASPQGDRLTADFALNLMINENLGLDSIPDYLAVSFSGLDAVNHFFGPSSLENEDMVLQLDRTLAGLLQFVDEKIGMQHVLIVLSADHGMAELPEYMSEQGMEAGRLTTDVVTTMAAKAAKDLFGQESLVKFYYRPFVYLDQEVLLVAGLDQQEVASAMAARLTQEPGIHLAITPVEVGTAPDSALLSRVGNNIHPVRSGDIYIVQDPYWFNFDKGPVAAMHGSPWSYDTHVSVIFAGIRIPSQFIYRQIQPADVAPTLSALLGMSPPASAQGTVLPEVFGEMKD
jgi:predicted AlkP superfamily pyrophosphatase or phosphodiesterase